MNNYNKVAFTLFEVAVVLVIIGVIAVMILKGGAVIRVAEFKHEGYKVQKIRYALATFEKRNGRLPGDYASAGIITHNQGPEARAELMDAGFIIDSDLKSTFDRGKDDPLIWEFRRCFIPAKKNFELNANSETQIIGDDRGYICVELCKPDAASTRYSKLTEKCVLDDASNKQQASAGIVGGYELYFDDADFATGFGRSYPSYTIPNYSKCKNDDDRCKIKNGMFSYDTPFTERYLIQVWP